MRLIFVVRLHAPRKYFNNEHFPRYGTKLQCLRVVKSMRFLLQTFLEQVSQWFGTPLAIFAIITYKILLVDCQIIALCVSDHIKAITFHTWDTISTLHTFWLVAIILGWYGKRFCLWDTLDDIYTLLSDYNVLSPTSLFNVWMLYSYIDFLGYRPR